MNERRMNLDPRLSAIAELVGRCESYADIGCDHGRLGAFLLKTGQVQRAALTDISEDSLTKARRLIDRLGLNDRVDFKVGDGAGALDRAYPVVVIAGMGGALIEKLVREGRERLGGARLILQPNVAHCALRKGLMEAGYAITDERIAPDGRRNYLIIVAEPGEARYTERELIAGPVLLKTLPETMEPFAAFYLRVAQKALAGAEKGGDAAQIDALVREIAIWEDVLKCL
ncbi:MAG: tRNA (adenine(22)-N(1))-methyltransferase TrmK [Clostridia bacterium]|nr:tRNA (adenine(22)-N(1))-methyltransferase TrmK [Clostridia bacterium]